MFDMSGQTSSHAQISGTVIEQLAQLLTAAVSDSDRQRAGLHLLDWAGCAVAGRVEPAGEILLKGLENTPSGQAFAWGGLGNILEMDDVDKRGLLHPGPVIIPAIVALAIEENVSGNDLLDALVRGYEATIRLGRSVGPGHYAFWHNTGTCGGIGAAAAAASLLKLDSTATAHAMALAVSQSAGLWQTRHEPASMGKQLHTCVAARAGLDAAKLAASGFKGPLSILEGPQGFFAAMCKGSDPAAVIAGEAGWRIHDVSFKPWPACRHAHAVIDATLALRDGVKLEDPGEFVVETYPDAIVFCDRPEPKTVIEAKFSLQHAVAVTMLYGAPQLEYFEPLSIADPEVAALRKRVVVREGAQFRENYPARFGSSVAFGVKKVSVEDALGDPENPVGVDQLKTKAKSLMRAGGLSDEAASALMIAAQSASADLGALIRSALS